jgi:hypothetical protein
MLRITVHDTLESLTFQLEGRLAGPWGDWLDGFHHLMEHEPLRETA